jgi:hypothetical protein
VVYIQLETQNTKKLSGFKKEPRAELHGAPKTLKTEFENNNDIIKITNIKIDML